MKFIRKLIFKWRLKKRKRNNPGLYIRVINKKQFLELSDILGHKRIDVAKQAHIEALELGLPVYVCVNNVCAMNRINFGKRRRRITYQKFKRLFNF